MTGALTLTLAIATATTVPGLVALGSCGPQGDAAGGASTAGAPDASAMRAAIRDELEAELRVEIERELRPRLRAELEAEVEAAVRARVERELAASTRRDPPDAGATVASVDVLPTSALRADVIAATDDASPTTAVARPDAAAGTGDPWATPGVKIWPKGGGFRVIEIAVGTGLEEKLPVNVKKVYDTVPELLYCYTVFENPGRDTTVTHVWRRGSRLVSRVELEVGASPRWKTWSKQRTQPHWTGLWSCEVLGPDGQQLGLSVFQLGGGGP
ncbi:MAG: DUF2914 domain-containing protein [Deltaproteobacteria bacterium]|nr:DUF2914 domain-containing protein [Deltaproteobacteria bacterium]